MSERHSEAGFSLLEAVIVFTIVTALTAMITQSLTTLSRNQRWSERQSAALSKAERIVQGVASDLEAAVRVFTENEESRSLLTRLDLGTIVPLSSAVLPTATSRGFFAPDAEGKREAGNMLLVARAIQPIDVPTGIGSHRARIDRYQFVLYSLSRSGPRLDIDRWASMPVARANDIAEIADPDERTGTIMALHQAGVTIAWRADEPIIESSLFALNANGGAPLLDPSELIPSAPREVQSALLERARLVIARNGAAMNVPVPLYAHALSDYPHGFEVKLDGDGTGRLVLVRLVVGSPLRPGERPVFASVERLISVREP